MEIRKNEKELSGTSETEREKIQKLEKLFSESNGEEVTREEADRVLNVALEVSRENGGEVSFGGSLETAERYLKSQKSHLDKAADYERKANSLETDIRRKREPESRESEVKKLRNLAKDEKREADRCKNRAKSILNDTRAKYF